MSPIPPGFYTVEADGVVRHGIRWRIISGEHKDKMIIQYCQTIRQAEITVEQDGEVLRNRIRLEGK